MGRMRFAENLERARQDDEALWKAYKSPGRGVSDERVAKAREALILRYLPLVNRIAARILMTLPSTVKEEDLTSYGILGLIDAIDRFDPTRGVKFEAYASKRIRGAMMDSLRELDWVPRSIRSRMRKFQEGLASGESAGYDPARGTLLSLDEFLAIDEQGGVVHVFDVVANPESPDPQATLEAEELKEILAQAIDELPERERLVVSLYYYDELSAKEIAKVLGVSQSRVSQIHSRAMERIHARLVAAGYA